MTFEMKNRTHLGSKIEHTLKGDVLSENAK
jgi:hypothetical protein